MSKIIAFPERLTDKLWLIRGHDNPEANRQRDKIIEQLRHNATIIPEKFK